MSARVILPTEIGNVVVIVQSLSPVQLFCDPMDCSLQGSSVHGISQARILEWVPFPSPGDLPTSPALAGGLFAAEPAGKPNKMLHTFILKTGWNSFRVDNNLI